MQQLSTSDPKMVNESHSYAGLRNFGYITVPAIVPNRQYAVQEPILKDSPAVTRFQLQSPKVPPSDREGQAHEESGNAGRQAKYVRLGAGKC